MARTEEAIFQDLAQLCVVDGYAHVVAYLCYRDNIVRYKDKLTAKNFDRLSSENCLIRTEISTLIGLMCKAEISLEIPHPNQMQELIKKTEELLKELHESMTSITLNWEAIIKNGESHFASAMAMREPIFYSGESAYDFQYRELAFRKYANDAQWFEKEKGFALADAKMLVDVIGKVLNEQMPALSTTSIPT